MKQQFYLIICVFSILLLNGCREDKEEFIPDVDGVVIFQTDLIGIITDENGDALPAVTIEVDGSMTSTDANGVFKMSQVNVQNGKLFVQADKSGYFGGSRTAIVLEDRMNFVRISLLPRIDRGTVNGATGGRIDLPGDVRFTFPANGVVDATSGDAYAGDVHVYYQYLDPNNDLTSQQMPGNLFGRRLDGTEQFLETYGMMAVELTDDNGNPLQVSSTSQVIVDAPVPNGINNVAGEIPLWSFNELTGSWVEESMATIAGDMMTGNLTHFSWWNFDLPTEQITICGHVEYAVDGTLFTPNGAFIMGCICRDDGLDGKPAVCGYTDNQGDFKARVPVGETFTLKFKNECGEVIDTYTIGPFTEDADIGPFTIDAPVESYSDIQGRLLDCDGDPVANGYVRIEVGNITQLIEVTTDGTFMGRVQVCEETSFDFTGVDLDNIKQSLTATHPVAPTVELGDIDVCDVLDEYLLVDVNGQSTLFVELSHHYSEEYTYIYSITNDTSNISLGYDDQDVGIHPGGIEGSLSSGSFIYCGIQADEFNVTVLTQEDIGGYIEGVFSGEMCQTGTGESGPITGSFRVIREQ